MRIVLSEIRGEQKLASREFKQTDLKIGRDELQCNLVFDRVQWPMVSRLHAELHFDGGRCYLTDPGSTYGTFLNGQRVTARMEVQPGARIQLGPQGPVLSVESIDNVDHAPILPKFSETLIDVMAAKQQAALRSKILEGSKHEPPPVVSNSLVDGSDRLEPATSEGRPSARKPSRSLADTPPARTVPQTPPSLICESGSPAQVGQRFTLQNDRILIGRDASADIVIAANEAAVSRRHAEIRRQSDGNFLIGDLKSFNGTLLNQQRIAQPERLHNGDQVQLGAGGPILRFSDPSNPTARARDAISLLVSGSHLRQPSGYLSATPHDIGSNTLVARPGIEQPAEPITDASGAQLLFERRFNGKQRLTVGRGTENDIQLDGLLISKRHARFINTVHGVLVENAGATNGVYLNGSRVSGRQVVGLQDVVQIGPFLLRAEANVGVAVFDTRAKTRIDAIGITETVARVSGRGKRPLLDDVSFAISANEFVGVLGPSGSGKSTLMNAINGVHRTSSGTVLFNHLELYQHIDSLKQSIGYVPQDDIIHRELTVFRTLYYVARLRLSRDVLRNEVDQIVGEVLDVTGLTSRRDVLVSQLSGGQRKRVSIAVELITKPSVIFLDEPTSGLDPATEQRIMELFRQIAESGRTVILTTHAMENVHLFDKVVLLMGGKLIFYGTPAEVIKFVGVTTFVDLYSKIEEPVESEIAKLGPPATGTTAEHRAYEVRCSEIADAVAEVWRRRFMATDSFRRYVTEPLGQLQHETQTAHPARRRRSLIDALLQWITLVRRYSEVLASDKWNLLILFGQAPVFGLLVYLVVGKNDPRDFAYFILALVSIWFGTSVAARELVKERPIFRRERMVNLRLLPYVGSKLLVLSFIVGLQATLFFGTLKILHFAGVMYLPGFWFGLPQLLVLALTGVVGIALGLFVSAVVKTSEVATSLVPLVLIPQILFAGLTAVPTGLAKLVGSTMPATWSFDEMKRLSTLDTLKPEGSNPRGENEGKGLFEHTKELNEENIKEARIQADNYANSTAETLKEHQRKVGEYIKSRSGGTAPAKPPPGPPTIGAPPPIPKPREISDNLSNYVSFLHPWGNNVLNVGVLCVMLLGLIGATMVALRVRDR